MYNLNIKKGQGATEYLVLLAIVLIVGIVAVALLGGFSDMSGGAREAESKQYWAGSVRPFSIPEFEQVNDTLYLTLKNMEPQPLRIYNITAGSNTVNYTNGISFAGGSKKTVSIPGFSVCDATSNDFFEYNLTLIYGSSDISGQSQSGNKPLSGRCSIR